VKKKFKVGVTGGIGGGKSSLCSYFASLGYPVLYADDISKEILSSNKKIKNDIIKTFGSEAYLNSKLNVKFLADKVFNNPSAVKKMNAIVHPAVIGRIDKETKILLKEHSIVFVEAALIYEAKIEDKFDYVIVVTADEDIRKKRLKKKGINEQEFERRSKNQISEETKKKKADFVFENNNDESELRKKGDLFLKIISM
jgi:dephospho-CoA kinase